MIFSKLLCVSLHETKSVLKLDCLLDQQILFSRLRGLAYILLDDFSNMNMFKYPNFLDVKAYNLASEKSMTVPNMHCICGAGTIIRRQAYHSSQ